MAMSRSENMRRIRSTDTAAELVVRRALRSLGYTGYRLHRRDVPGRPDVAFVGRRKAIFVHGCFWHGHDCAEGVRKPKSNQGTGFPRSSTTANEMPAMKRVSPRIAGRCSCCGSAS